MLGHRSYQVLSMVITKGGRQLTIIIIIITHKIFTCTDEMNMEENGAFFTVAESIRDHGSIMLKLIAIYERILCQIAIKILFKNIVFSK